MLSEIAVFVVLVITVVGIVLVVIAVIDKLSELFVGLDFCVSVATGYFVTGGTGPL